MSAYNSERVSGTSGPTKPRASATHQALEALVGRKRRSSRAPKTSLFEVPLWYFSLKTNENRVFILLVEMAGLYEISSPPTRRGAAPRRSPDRGDFTSRLKATDVSGTFQPFGLLFLKRGIQLWNVHIAEALSSLETAGEVLQVGSFAANFVLTQRPKLLC